MEGIEKTKKGIKALTDLIERGEVVFKEGIGSINELKNLVISLFDTGVIIKEIKDLDEAEKAELVAALKEDLDLENDQLEELIEKFAECAAGIAGVVALVMKSNEPGQGPIDPDP